MKTSFSRFSCRTLGLVLALALMPAAAWAQADSDSLQPLDIDQEYLALAKEHPGFGGLFHDEEGVANIYVTADADRASFTRLTDSEVNFLEAEFAWDQLYEYRGRMIDVLSEPGVTFLDIDEAKNRVHVGITGLSKLRANHRAQMAARYGVPAQAILLSDSDPFESHVSLRDARRPIPGGMQIGFSGFLCTLGFPVTRNGQNGFITNSHCTAVQGGNQNTAYRQPTGAIIARESIDPNYGSIAGCPSGRRCRRSDSAYARWVGSGSGQRGRIARPVCRNCGNLTIAGGGNSRFTITSEANVGVGTFVNKVGRTTGWTSGRKTNSCVTTNVAGTNITLICQDFASYNSNSGDSGSPVFQRLGSTNARLAGINWGGNASTAVYSPINEIKRELGNFRARR